MEIQIRQRLLDAIEHCEREALWHELHGDSARAMIIRGLSDSYRAELDRRENRRKDPKGRL